MAVCGEAQLLGRRIAIFGARIKPKLKDNLLIMRF